MRDDDLRIVLTRYPAIARPCSEPEALGNAGGGSGARLWRFASGRGLLVARAWPPDGTGRAALERIHRWLHEAAGLGFIPVPLAARDGRTLHEQGGRLWEVCPWMPGNPASSQPLTSPRLRAGFITLAACHQCLKSDRCQGQSPALLARLRKVDALLRSGFATIERALSLAPDDPAIEPARQWLSLARTPAPRLLEPLQRAAGRKIELQPCLRDARPEHLLFEGDRVTGLVDFGAMAVDSVAADLARLLAEWVGADRAARAEALSAYASVRPLDEVELPLIDAFESSAALLGAGHWVRWHFIEQRPFDDPTAVERGIRRGLERLSRLTVG